MLACALPGSSWALDRRGSGLHHHLHGKRAEEEEEEEVQPLGSTVHLHRIHLSGGSTHCSLHMQSNTTMIQILIPPSWQNVLHILSKNTKKKKQLSPLALDQIRSSHALLSNSLALAATFPTYSAGLCNAVILLGSTDCRRSDRPVWLSQLHRADRNNLRKHNHRLLQFLFGIAVLAKSDFRLGGGP